MNNKYLFNKFFLFSFLLLFITFNSLFANTNNLVDKEADEGNLYENICDDIYEPTLENTYEDIWSNTEESILLEDGVYDKFLEKVSKVDPSSRHKFAAYYSNWYYSGQKDDFITYSQIRAEKEKRIDYCYDKIIAKFGIGTGIVASTWIVAFVLPGGSIWQAAVLVVAEYGTFGGPSGALIGGVISLGQAIIEGKTGDDLIYDTLNGAADGFLIGVITSEISGIAKVSSLMKEAKTLKNFSGTNTIFNNKVYNDRGKYIGTYRGEVSEINGRAIINKNLVGTTNYGVKYTYQLADDGAGNYYRIVNPDFEPYKLVNKVYHPPKSLWNNSKKAKEWCKKAYRKDLQDPNVEKILGITKKEAAMRLQFEKGNLGNLRDPSFMKANNISEKEINSFLKYYSKGAWHHLPSSGELIYVPEDIHEAARHTGGDSFWGEKLEEITW